MLIDTKELLPHHLQKLYQMILKGEFINENSSKRGNSELYEAVVEQEKEVREYFRIIGYALIRREGYFYFAHDDAPNTQSALEKIVDYIDIANFLKMLDSNFGVGYRFRLDSVENLLNNNIELQEILAQMKGLQANTNRESVQKIVDRLRKDGFVEEQNSANGEYVVLNSYDYIEAFLSEVEIYE
jgi:triacylglycerol esterase/lipase EstA (alpha/beta hydrolase family)